MKKSIVTIVIAALILIVVGVIVIEKIVENNTPGTEVMSLEDYYKVAADKAMIIMDDKVYEKDGLWFEGHPYIDHDSVTELFYHRFFWSAEENMVVLTTPDKVIRMTPCEKTIYVNDEEQVLEYAPAALKDKDLYISIEYLADYADLKYSIFNNPNRVMIQHKWDEYLYSDVVEDTQIRNDSNIKAPIVEELKAGDKVMYIDGGGIQQNGFVKVMSADGVRGYINTEFISDSYYEEVSNDYSEPEYVQTPHNGPVYLGWELLYTSENVGFLQEHLSNSPEVNVVSPTWFYMCDTDGNLINYANAKYVEYAHSKGVEVWALFKNDSVEGRFSCVEDTHKVMSSFASRHNLIENMMAEAAKYNLDGINIDFEALKADTGRYFVEFLRELSVRCRAAGIILSVDNYVPAGYNAFYDYEEQGRIIDYLIMMGYDEHYKGSEEAGSVSSLPWFGESIDNTLSMVSPERVIFAVPFYTRLWKETPGSEGGVDVGVVSTPNMQTAADTLRAYNITPEWDDETGQYYGEYEKGGAKYRIWLEDIESLTKKVELIGANNLAGVAAWKLGDETKGTWSAIVDTYNECYQ